MRFAAEEENEILFVTKWIEPGRDTWADPVDDDEDEEDEDEEDDTDLDLAPAHEVDDDGDVVMVL